MKKLSEIPEAWKNTLGESDEIWKKDELIERLKQVGHHPISVDRAVVVIEQCEKDGDFPGKDSEDPLKITIYPDPDAGFGDEPDELYIHAGRSGLWEVFTGRRYQGKKSFSRLVEIDAEKVEKLKDVLSLKEARAVSELAQVHLTGYYQVGSGKDSHVQLSKKLQKLGAEIQQKIQKYMELLEKTLDE